MTLNEFDGIEEISAADMDAVNGGAAIQAGMLLLALFVEMANGANSIDNPPEHLQDSDWGGWDFSGM